MVAHTCNPSASEAEAGEFLGASSQVRSQTKTLSQKHIF